MDISLTDVVTYTKAIQNLNKNFITTINYDLSSLSCIDFDPINHKKNLHFRHHFGNTMLAVCALLN